MSETKSLNPEQEAAIIHGEGPLLIIAGAGTGKTTVVTERIKHLILDKKVSPANILALTFTEKAAQEMEERIDIAMPYGYTQMWIATFHAFCDRILRNEAINIGLNPAYKLATEAEAILFLRQHLFKIHLDYFRPIGNPYKFIQGLLQHFSRLKDEDITPEQYIKHAEDARRSPLDAEELEAKKISELAQAYKTYEELKEKEGVMDFSDLIANVLKLFRLRPNILAFYQKQFEYVLIDEFQDTNYAQNQLAILLAGKRKNITVVGDDDQAIYRWRGAAISNMIQFRKHFPDVKIVTLTKNYRSTKHILDSAYTLIQNNNPDRLEIKENINKKLEAVRNIQGDTIDFLFADRVENEAENVVAKIKELTRKFTKGGYSFKDFAILVRANDHAQPFIRALEHAGIPYQFLGPGQLFHQEEIKDLIAYLKVLYNFEDTASLYRVLNMQIFGMHARDIATLLNYGKKKNLCLFEVLEQLEEISLPEEKKEKLTTIVKMLQQHISQIPKQTAGKILYFFLENSGLLESFINPTTALEESKALNIAKFFEKLKSYEAQHEDASVFAIVDWIDLSMQMGESPLAANIDWADNNAVNILTIHSSKGLEFPIVFLVSLVTQRFPSRERREQIPISEGIIKEILPEGDYHLQEERRLFYVAVTRARDKLFLSAANFYGEGKRERKISPFVYETVGEDFVNRKKTKNALKANQLSLLDMFAEKDNVTSTMIAVENALINRITYISYSQLQTFDICPLHYKLRYILKIPTTQTSAQTFGTSVHAALRDFYQMHVYKETVSFDDIPAIVKSTFINEGYASKDHAALALERATYVVKKFIEHDFHPDRLPIALEIPFIFTIKHPTDWKLNLKVGGRIDRIDQIDEDTIEIIDYKTGSNIPDEKELAKNLQMTFYGLAAAEVHDGVLPREPDFVKLSLHYVEENIKVTTTRTREQLEEAKATILQRVDAIVTSDFICSKSVFCINCEYKILCNTH